MEQTDENGLIFCYGCMRQLNRSGIVCPHCGYDNSRTQNAEDLLPEGTILSGQYLVGKKLGRGGFGVTYLGYDLVLEQVIAIKEYFPMGLSTRTFQTHRVSFSADVSSGFNQGLRKFRDEALNLVKFSSPGIVRVRNFLTENGTAYIIMDFVRGTDLADEIADNGRLPWQRVVKLFDSLILELGELHKQNLIHRDIKPANIKVVPGEQNKPEHLVLLDFGSARSFVSENVTGTYTAILTPGYAPIEQYSAMGHQGPYTDVYGICATMYHAITGEIPPVSTALVTGEARLKSFRELGLNVPDPVENAIRHGMAADYSQRTRNMEELYSELNSGISASDTKMGDNRDQRSESLYRSALKSMEPDTKKGYADALEILRKIPGYRDADALAERCQMKLREPDRKFRKRLLIAGIILIVLAAGASFFFFNRRARENVRRDELTPGAVYSAESTDQNPSSERGGEIEISESPMANATETEEIPKNTPSFTPVTPTAADTFTPTPLIPGVPEIKDIQGENGNLTVSWKPVPNADSYEVYYSTAKDGEFLLFEKSESTSVSGKTPVIGGKIWIRICACGEGGCSDHSSVWSYYYPAPTASPVTPTVTPVTPSPSPVPPTATATFTPIPLIPGIPRIRDWKIDSGMWTVNWDPVPNAEHYEICYSLSENGSYAVFTRTTDVSVTQKAPVNSGKVWIRIRACGKDGCSGLSGSWSYTYPVPTSTPLPTATATQKPTRTPVPPSATPKPFTATPARRRLNVGDIITFGHYEQDNNSYNGQEAIEWQVLAVENSRALLISRYILDSRAYQGDRNGITWERSSIRSWLNSTFYNSAFSYSEQRQISATQNSNPVNPRFSGGKGGNSTTDYIFLLSIDEANRYFGSDSGRRCKLTSYAYAKGGTYSIDSTGYGWWWLRSAGQNNFCAADVLPAGSVNLEGYWTDDYTVGIRPAFWMNY